MSTSSALRISYTSWKHSHHVHRGFEVTALFASLAALLRYQAKVGLGPKKQAPLWAPIECRGHAYDHEVTRISALVLDYDAGSINLDTVHERLVALGAAFVLHDSPSATPQHPKWRLILPLSQPVPPENWKERYLAAAQILGEALLPLGEAFDLSCQNPAHRWFFPWRIDKSQPLRRVLSQDGKTFDIERFSEALTRPTKPAKTPSFPNPIHDAIGAMPMTERARRYLRQMDRAISGQKGHDQTLRAARVLVKDFDLDVETAFSLLWEEFNPRCQPPWTEKELRHKVHEAQKLQVAPGRLVKEDKLPPKKTKTAPTPPEKKGPLLVREAERRIQEEILAADLREQVITVLQVPCGGGKSHAAVFVAKLLQLLSAKEDQGRTALLGPTHQWAQEMLQRAADAGISASRFFSPPGEGGLRAPLPKGAPNGAKGALLCKLSRPALAAHYAAGWQGQEICHLCPFREECPSKPGRAGMANAKLAIATHQNPNAAIQDARRVWVDERPELLEQRTAKQEALRILKKGLESLGPKSQKVIANAAAAVLDWLADGAPQDIDPLAKHRAALKELCDEGRAKLRRTPDYDPYQHKEEIGAARDLEAWKAATWLLDAALKNAKLFATSEKEPAFHQETPITQVLREAKRVVLLSATPGDLHELETLTGKKVHLVVFPVEGTAKRELIHLKTRSATRRSYLDHGRPRLTRKHTRKGEIKTEASALVYDLHAIARQLRQRKEVHTAFLATFRPIAAALRLILSAGQGGGTLDRAYWEGLYGSTEAANEALAKFQAIAAPLFSLLKERGITLWVGHYGALEGLDGFKDADAFITLGDPNVNVDDHKRRYAQVRGVSVKQLAEEGAAQAWQSQYNQEAAAELCQAHGRDRWPTRTKEVFHLHIGATVPMGWPEDIQVEQRVGRQKNEANEEGAELVEKAIEVTGGARAAARGLDVPWQTFQRYASGERAVPAELVEKIRAKYPELRGGPKSPIPVLSYGILIGELEPPPSLSLNRGIGATPFPRILIGESEPPPSLSLNRGIGATPFWHPKEEPPPPG